MTLAVGFKLLLAFEFELAPVFFFEPLTFRLNSLAFVLKALAFGFEFSFTALLIFARIDGGFVRSVRVEDFNAVVVAFGGNAC